MLMAEGLTQKQAVGKAEGMFDFYTRHRKSRGKTMKHRKHQALMELYGR
jgi:hypothetical protein